MRRGLGAGTTGNCRQMSLRTSCRGLNNYRYSGSTFQIRPWYHALQTDLTRILAIIWAFVLASKRRLRVCKELSSVEREADLASFNNPLPHKMSPGKEALGT